MQCGRDLCSEQQQPYVRLGYTEGDDTSITAFTPWGSNTLDLEPIVKNAETDTTLSLNCDTKQIDYQSEKHEDHICLNDMWALMSIEDHGNADKNLKTGDAYVYNASTKQWEAYPLKETIERLLADNARQDATIDDLNNQVFNLMQQVNNIAKRIGDIEGAIYNWSNDKTTKIPRGNINVFSGGMGSNNYIRSRDGNPNNDVNFE